MRDLIAIVSGLLFGLGLIAGGMVNPDKVQGFLDVAGSWDPSLAFVMAGAIAVGVFAFAAAKRHERAWSGDKIDIPTNKTIDARLIGGGALFGIGWGLAGFCPGPALVALGSGRIEALLFVPAMLAGMALHDRLIARG